MATSTSNLGLIKPAGTDHALVANINTNSDTIDTEAGKARANFALVQNGDTATQAISKDQLVVWKGVLKKASANIASGATLSSSNLSDDTIAAELAALNSNLSQNQWTLISNLEVGTCRFYKNEFLKLIFATISGDVGSKTAETWTLPASVPIPVRTIDTAVFCMNSSWIGLGEPGTMQIKSEDRTMNFTSTVATKYISGYVLYPYNVF